MKKKVTILMILIHGMLLVNAKTQVKYEFQEGNGETFIERLLNYRRGRLSLEFEVRNMKIYLKSPDEEWSMKFKADDGTVLEYRKQKEGEGYRWEKSGTSDLPADAQKTEVKETKNCGDFLSEEKYYTSKNDIEPQTSGEIELYAGRKGTFYYLEKGRAVSFRVNPLDKTAGLRGTEKSKKEFEDWLKEDKGFSLKTEAVSLGELVYHSLENPQGLNGIYTEADMIMTSYLEKFYESGKNVYSTRNVVEKGWYNPDKYERVTPKEGQKIAEEAKRYVEKEVPYVRNGIDTPSTVGLKRKDGMYLKLTQDYSSSIVNINKYTGCDGNGFLTGIIGELGLKVPVEGTSGTGEKFADYRKKIEESLNKGRIPNLNKEIQSLRIKMEEMNLYTVIVPQARETQPGDIIIAGNNMAVVTEISVGRELKESKAVWMGKKKAREGKLEEFLTDTGKSEGEIEIRRLLKEKETSPAGEYHAPKYDILSKAMTSGYEVEVTGYREETQKSKENWRFMPNTGEYLLVEGLKIKRTINLPLDVSSVEFMGAEDRNYSKDKAGAGNIHNNRAKKFQAAMIGKDGKINGSERKLEREAGNLQNYQLEEGGSGYRFETFMSDEELFFVDEKTGSRKLSAKLGIRPIDSAHAYPGDDLILKFKIKTPYGDCIVTTSEKDYIAVYDKKMLWRANLYIDEGAGDWNNVHPWNAPPAGDNDKITGTWADSNSKSYLAHWNATDWGYNEWNRKYEKYKGIAGGQLISIPSTKWCYGYDNKSQHVITKAVAYDHQGWDSPFSFNEKVESQKKLLNQWYISDGEKRFKKPVYQWPESCTDLGAYKANLGEELCGSETDLDKLKKLYNSYKNNSSSRWNGELDSLDYKKYIFSKNYGDKTKEPYKDYEGFTASFISDVTKNAGNVTSGNDDAVSIDGKTCYPYVPGLSDSLMTTLRDYPSSEIGKITAGVDCTGFVMSSAGYKGEHYKAMPAANIPKPIFWEDETIPIPIQKAWHSEENAVKVGDWNTKKDIDYKKDNGELDSKSVYSYFTHLVPGDIVWYSGHIMMVSSITDPDGYDTVGKPYWNDGSGVKMLESVFTYGNTEGKGELFSCGKTRELDCILKKPRYWEIWRQK